MFHIIQNQNKGLWWIVGFGKLWFSGSGGADIALECAKSNNLALYGIDLKEAA
jgi:hypothetical protein